MSTHTRKFTTVPCFMAEYTTAVCAHREYIVGCNEQEAYAYAEKEAAANGAKIVLFEHSILPVDLADNESAHYFRGEPL